MKTAEPIHPGEILLEEFLKASDPPIPQTEAAGRLGWSFVRLNQLVNGKRAVTPENALDLAAFTGTSPEFWLNLQQRFDLWQAQRDRERRDIHHNSGVVYRMNKGDRSDVKRLSRLRALT